MKTAVIASIAVSLSLAACAHSQFPAPVPVEPIDAEGHGPPPFSAEQIRDASAKGRTYVFRVEAAGEPVTILRMEFVDVGHERVTIRRTVATEAGELLSGPTDLTSTWEELRSHALWPAAGTTIADDTVDVPAGRFDAVRYTVVEVEDGREIVTTAWFARSLPGAPVLMTVSAAGMPPTTMTLVEHIAGE